MRLSTEQWRDGAPDARPVLIGSTADVDDIYIKTSARLRAPRWRGGKESGLAAELALAVGRLLSEGRDGHCHVIGQVSGLVG
jgi:hypothetical protein